MDVLQRGIPEKGYNDKPSFVEFEMNMDSEDACENIKKGNVIGDYPVAVFATTKKSEFKKMLSPFQKEKLEFYFRFFDTKGNNFLEYNNLGEFRDKIFKFTKWSPTSTAAQEFGEVHETFYEVLKEKAGESYDDKVTLSEWLALWETIIPGCMSMINCPIWLRLLPRSLFRIIDRKDNNVIDEEELCDFYVELINLQPDEAKKIAKKGYEEMTDYGRYPLNLEGYEQIFSNFLFGRTPYGPGRYIFGCFEHRVEDTKFKLIQNAPGIEDKTKQRQDSGRDSGRAGDGTYRTRRPSLTKKKSKK
ncbi:unnamed protein product [Mytilus edulis]|uniref:EF-hand domain-containing protein n=1 Tax=Mytilus edulis TaxID=6550 RepID=A0A8S3SEN5_MYTED|nr:unnamed protein product [Mytilus edulis]